MGAVRRHHQQRSRIFIAQHQQDPFYPLQGQSSHAQRQYAQEYTQQDWYAQQTFTQELPAGWASGVDPSSGATYYFNEQTGEAQWEPPQPGYGGLQTTWRVASVSGWGPMGSAGRYTLRNGRANLVVLGRYDMELTKPYRPYVSRRQCELQLQADGSATLVSTGKPPTLWRPAGGQWVALQRGEGLVLTDGDQVSVDAHDSESTVFACKCFLEQDDRHVVRALNDVTLAEERLRQSAQHSPCAGPSMEALEALEAADARLAAEENARYDLR